MTGSITRMMQVLERTPDVLTNLLSGLDDDWVMQNEGPDTWSPYDVVGHLIHGERTDWIARMQIIISETGNKTFEPFDRFAQFRESEGKSMGQLLEEFRTLRMQNMEALRSLDPDEEDLQKTGTHPSLGEVTLANLLSTWTAHDLNHIAQIVRVMAGQYKQAVGPWKDYLRILNQ